MRKLLILITVAMTMLWSFAACSVGRSTISLDNTASEPMPGGPSESSITPKPTATLSPEIIWLPEDGSMTPEEQENQYYQYVKDILGAEKVDFGESLSLPEYKLEKDKVVMDLNSDGKQDTINISVIEDFVTDPNVPTNKPIKITFEIGDLKTAYENKWNDNVYLYIADVNPTDRFMDICLVSTGTGAGDYATTIYRYDGKSIYKFADYEHYMRSLYYDKKGNVYFVAMDFMKDADGLLLPKGPVMKVLNMVNGEIALLKDKI